MSQTDIRPAIDSEAASFVGLISEAWKEYTGNALDVDEEMPEWRNLATHYRNKGGNLWAAASDGLVVGMVAVAPYALDTWEISRMYVGRAWRGSGLAHRLIDTVEATARAAGATRMVLWSDTRFPSGHRFYEKRSYVRAGLPKILGNAEMSLDYPYAKPLTPLAIELADSLALSSCERILTRMLTDAAAAGGDLGFPCRADAEFGRLTWRETIGQVAGGRRIVLLAWCEGVVSGSVEVDLRTRPTEPTLARVERLLVSPAQEGGAVARELVAHAQAVAKALGRTLLIAAARDGTTLEGLLLECGWNTAGSIPDATVDADGLPSIQKLFWRRAAY